MTDAAAPPELSPLQNKTLGLLRRAPDPVVFDTAFIASLRSDIESAFAEFHARLGDETIFVNKYKVRSVLGCEAQHVLPDDFEWTPPRAIGTVAHRAIELMIGWRGVPEPDELVDEALERLAERENGFGDWIAGLGEADRADIRSPAINRVISFQDCFPPFGKDWRVRTEASIRWPVDGPILLSGKVDLALGRPRGAESTLVIIDLKSGRVSPHDRDDLRFYALVEMLRTQIPPRKVASFYLDAGEPVVEDVTEATLLTASRRMLDAVNAEIELHIEGREPIKRPGASCRWCPLRPECAEGRAHLDGEFDRNGF